MKSQSPIILALQRFRRIRSAVISCCFILLWIVMALFAYLIIPDSLPNANSQHLEIAGLSAISKVNFLTDTSSSDKLVPVELLPNGVIRNFEGDTLITAEKPTTKFFLLGTDRFGRDVLSRLILGSRYSLAVGLVSVFISLLVGTILGAIAGYFGGWIDALISWFTTVIWSIPLMLLAIAITMALGKGLIPLFLAIGLATWVDVARVVRGQVLSIKEKEFVEAGRAFGFTHLRIIIVHILPNLSGILLVLATSNFASAILLESGLNFLGLGAQPPIPTWGNMVRDHIGYLFSGNIMAMISPSLSIFLIVLAFSSVGNALRDTLDVKYLEKTKQIFIAQNH